MPTELQNDLVLRAARGEQTERTPIWMMRQAGRFDPEYIRVRDEANLPLERMFNTPELAARISLLPQRFGVDAIIFYQDILTPLAPLGAPFVFRPGPVLERPVRNARDIARLKPFDPAEALPFVPETLRLVREQLNGALPVLGFAGAPLTLACFMAEGGSPGESAPAMHALLQADPESAHRLLAMLADMTADYLALQIEAGVGAVQLFESCANLFSVEEYRAFALPYQQRVFERLGRRAPRILFARERTEIELLAQAGADVLSLGPGIDLAAARNTLGTSVPLQGNIDNHLLATGTPAQAAAAAEACIRALAHRGHILNLSHGLLRNTPVENVQAVIDTAHRIRCGGSQPVMES